jgi:quercetin dioxygenase-like cupin family protein
MASEGKSSVLAACVGQGQDINGLVEYSTDSVVSKTLLDKSAGTITLFAFDAGQRLSEHTAPYDAVVQVIEGTAVVTIDGNDKDVSAGELIIMPANIRHAVAARERFKMMLVMIRA